MVKKLLLGIFLLVLVGVGVILIFQPRALQQRVVHFATERLALSTPYRLYVGDVSGNFFTYFTLHDVRLSGEGMTEDLLQAESLGVGLVWRALLQRRIEVSTIAFEKPSVRLVVGPDHKLQLPESKKKESSATALPLRIEHFTITGGRLTLINQGVYPDTRLVFEPITLKASADFPRIDLQELAVGLKSGRLESQGHLLLTTPPSADLSVETVQWPFQELLKMAMTPPELLRLTHSGQLQLQWDDGHLKIKSRGTLEGSSLRLEGQVAKGAPSRFQLDLSPLAVNRVWRDPRLVAAGTLSAHLEGAVYDPKRRDVDVTGDVTVSRKEGETESPQTGALHVALSHGRGPVKMTMLAEGFQAFATAQVDLPAQSVDSQFSLAISSFTGLAEWFPAAGEMEGKASAYGSVKGPFQNLAVTVAGRGEEIYFAGRWMEEVAVLIEGYISRTQPLQAEVNIKNFWLNEEKESPWDVNKMKIVVDGKLPLWNLKVDATFQNKVDLSYAGHVGGLPGGWQAQWDSLSLNPPGGAALKTTQPGSVRSQYGVLEVAGLHLSDGEGEVYVQEVRFQPDTLALVVGVKALSFGPWLPAFSPGRKGEGRFDAQIRLKGSAKSPEGTADIKLSSGSLQGWRFREAGVRLRLDQPWLLVEDLRVLPTSIGHDVKGSGKIPWHLIEKKAPDLPLDITLKAPSLDPGILTAMVPGIVIDKGGNAGLIVTIDGHYPDVRVKGALSAHFPHIQIKPAGLDLRDFDAELVSNGRTLEIKQFKAKSKKGEVTMAGRMTLPELEIKIDANNLDINIPKMLEARVNAKLLLSGEVEAPDLSGEIRIREATYTKPTPKKKDKDEENSTDEMEQEKNTSPVWEATTMDVHAVWARGVWYRDGLTKIETSGDLRVQKEDDTTTPYMTGRISIMRGSYDAYGRDFLMDSGDIVFLGPPDINPALNLRAKYASGGTEVYLDVRGTLREPVLKLSSNPPLPEQDIISVLVVGRPLNQIGPTQNGASRDAQAAAVAGNVIGGYITRELRQSGMDVLGLDVVRVEPTTQGSRLMVGRYIGEKLFVSYGQPIQPTAGQVFDADYYLSKRWTLSAQTGSGATGDTHMDLEFRYPLNGEDKRGTTAPLGASISGR